MNLKETEKAMYALAHMIDSHKYFSFILGNGDRLFIRREEGILTNSLDVSCDEGAYGEKSFNILLLDKKHNLDLYIILGEGEDYEAWYGDWHLQLKEKSTGNKYHFTFH